MEHSFALQCIVKAIRSWRTKNTFLMLNLHLKKMRILLYNLKTVLFEERKAFLKSLKFSKMREKNIYGRKKKQMFLFRKIYHSLKETSLKVVFAFFRKQNQSNALEEKLCRMVLSFAFTIQSWGSALSLCKSEREHPFKKIFWKIFCLKQFFCFFSQIKINRFFHSILPIPLTTYNFHSQQRFSYLIIICKNQSKTRECNQSNNNTRQNCPHQFQRSMMIETLRNSLFAVMKSVHNTKSLPQNQNQNNNQKKLNICIQISNSFHNRSCRVLKPHLPCNRCICISAKHVHNHRNHSFSSVRFSIK